MSLKKIVALVLILAGVLILVYGGFSYTKESHDVKLGKVELGWQEKQKVNLPTWVGVGAVAVGAVLLLVGRGRE